MKTILSLFLSLILGACTHNSSSAPTPVHASGGVDVGNMRSAQVPQTNATLSYPSQWSSSALANVLSVTNQTGSTIEAKKSEITDLSSPNATSLQQYLKAKYPEREYKIISVNGLEGVRADLVDTDTNKVSDIYLVSELTDFIHIQSNLKNDANGIAEGDKIILTVRVKYQGLPYPDAPAKTVTLKARDTNTQDRYAYSLWGDCYTYSSDPGCNPGGGVAVTYENRFSVGASGYDHGRVVELGPESQIPFDSIKIEGEYLVAPLSNIPISDIYTAFSPKTPHIEQNGTTLKAGYVYLVRTINWPDEDLITKMRVDAVDGGSSATITYKKLVYVKKEELQKQIDLINQNTLANEMPLTSGEVTLYNRAVWDNYFYAAFNFQYSTSGNMFITNNTWDLMLEGPYLSVPRSGSGMGEVIDLGEKDIASVGLTDFPDPNSFRDRRVEVKKGHTYIVAHFDLDDGNAAAVYGAVQVVDVDPNQQWARLKFRRIKVGPAEYFQKWIPLAIPSGIQTISLEKTGSAQTSTFYPFINKRGDQGFHYYEYMNFNADPDGDSLTVDSRPYGNKRGFYKLGQNVSLDNFNVADVEALKGKFSMGTTLNQGDVIAVLLENYYDRTVMIMRVDEHKPNQSVRLSFKYLQRAKTAYSDDEN